MSAIWIGHLEFSHFAQKELHLLILTQLDDGSHLEFCHLGICHLGFNPLSFSTQPHSQLPTLVPTICTKNTSLTLPSPIFAQKNFTHSFWLHLMMEAILNSAILDSATAILNSETLLFSLRVTQKHSHSTLTLTQTNSICLKLIHSHLTWWWQPLWIVPSWIQPFCTKRTSPIHSHSLWLNLMMAAILNSAMLDSDTAILDSDTLLSSLRFTQKQSHSTLTLTQTNSIWLTWWWLPSWIWPSRIQAFYKKLWFKLIQSDSKSFILTQLDDGCHLEFCHFGFTHCHLGFRHLVIFSQIHSKTLSLHSDFDSN